MVAPIIPGLNDHEVPAILAAARDAGARGAGYVLLRLPGPVRDVFLDWLRRCRPNHAAKVETFLRSAHGGDLYRSQFGERQRGNGPIADQIAQSFRLFAKRNGFEGRLPELNAADFRPPRPTSGQLSLF
jgi:DNA repair photolyase